MTWYIGLGVGALAATLRFLLGWFKSGEPWEGSKMLRTLGIALIGGCVTGALWENGTPREVFVAVFGETVAVEELAVAAWRTLRG